MSDTIGKLEKYAHLVPIIFKRSAEKSIYTRQKASALGLKIVRDNSEVHPEIRLEITESLQINAYFQL